MYEIKKRLVEFKPHLKETTIRQYLHNLTLIYRKLYETDKAPQTLNFLKNKDKLDRLLETYKTDNTRKNYANIIAIFLTLHQHHQESDPTLPILINHFNKIRDDINIKNKKESKLNIKTHAQEKHWIPYDVIINIRDGLKSTDHQKYTLLSLMLRYPMRNDMRELKIMLNREYNKLTLEEKQNTNALIRSSKGYEFILNNYKTNKTYNEKRIPIDKEFNGMIKKQIKGRTYLFELSDGKHFNTNSFTKYLNSIFKHTNKKVSSCMLRHIVLSHKYGNILKEMKEDSHNMGHSIETQKDYIKMNF